MSDRVREGPSECLPKVYMQAAWKFDDFERPCLLVIDVQEKYNTEQTKLPAVLPNIVSVINTCREKGWDVYWTRYTGSVRNGSLHTYYGSSCDEVFDINPPKKKLVSNVLPREYGLNADRVFSTNHLSSFSNDKLETMLLKHDLIIVCGGWTDHCVTATAHDAFSRDISVCIVEDACFTVKRRGYHDDAIRLLGHTVAKIITTERLRSV